MFGTVLVVILILALLGTLPRWSHSRKWVTPRQEEWVWPFLSSSFSWFSSVSKLLGIEVLCAVFSVRVIVLIEP